MDVVGAFVEGLPGGQRHFLAALDLHDDAAFKHIDEAVGVMSVDRIGRAGRVVDDDHQRVLARDVRQVLAHQLRDDGVGRRRTGGGVGEWAQQRARGDKRQRELRDL